MKSIEYTIKGNLLVDDEEWEEKKNNMEWWQDAIFYNIREDNGFSIEELVPHAVEDK